jgi:hypothetical protein
MPACAGMTIIYYTAAAPDTISANSWVIAA